MDCCLTDTEIEELNRKHQHHVEIYTEGNPYTLGAVHYSKVTDFRDYTLFLDVFINNDWKKEDKKTAKFFFNDWLSKHQVLSECKYYQVSIYKHKALGFVIHNQDDKGMAIEQVVAQSTPLKVDSTLEGIYSNEQPVKSSLLRRLGSVMVISLGYSLVGILYISFFGLLATGLFVLNSFAFIDDEDMSLDLGILIVKSNFVKFLIVLLDILLIYLLFDYTKDKIIESVAKSKEKRQKKII